MMLLSFLAVAAAVLNLCVFGQLQIFNPIPNATTRTKEGSFVHFGWRDSVCKKLGSFFKDTKWKKDKMGQKLGDLGLNRRKLWLPVNDAEQDDGGASGREHDDARAPKREHDDARARKEHWRVLGNYFLSSRKAGKISDHVWQGTRLEAFTEKLLSVSDSPESFSSDPSVVAITDAVSLTPQMLHQAAQESKPIIVRNALRHAGWNHSRWSDSEVIANYGHLNLQVSYPEDDGAVSDDSTVMVRIDSFAKQAADGENVYARRLPVACAFPNELFFLPLPSLFSKSEFSLYAQGPQLYWSKGVTKYKLHRDNFDNYYTVIEGVKFMRLIDREDIRLKGAPWTDGGDSKVSDPIFNPSKRVGASPFTMPADVVPIDVVFNAGDALFLPAGWGHFTISASKGSHKAIALWMNHTEPIVYPYTSNSPPLHQGEL